MLDVRKLHMLAELDRLGTVAAVAKTLHLTAPGISMQLATLERELGVKLTERQGRRIVVTPAGRVMARHGREIVDKISIAEIDARDLLDGSGGTYRIAAFPSAARSLLAMAWAKVLHDNMIGIHINTIELEPADGLAALAAGEVDIAVTHAYSNIADSGRPGIDMNRIATENVYLVMRKEDVIGAGTGAVDLAVCADRAWIVPGRNWSCHEMVQRACGASGFEPRAIAEVTDYATQLALVSAGVGVALIPQLGLTNVPDEVIATPLRLPVYRHIFVGTRRPSTADAGVRRLVGILAESATAALESPPSSVR